jgi:uncharacterized protein
LSRKKQGGGKRRSALGHDEPFRACVACRASAPRHEMLRFVRAPDGAVLFDVHARADGRGAWTCAQAACIEKARARGGFERAFEATLVFEGDLLARVRELLRTEILTGLGLVRRAGALVAGRDEVARIAALEKADALVLAEDLSERTRGSIHIDSVVTLRGPPMADIGHAIGRKPTGVLLLKNTPRGRVLIDDLRRAERLAEPVRHA